MLGSGYFGFIGKKLRVKLFGRITTAATPGNGTWDIYWGTGADANGTILASSAAHALTASQTNLSWWAEFTVYCRAMGTSGALMCTGEVSYNNAVVASTLQPIMVPASAPAQVTVDTTQANIVSVQFKPLKPPTHTTAPNMCRARATAVMSELRIPRDEGYMLAHLTCQAPHRPPTLRRHPRDSHIRHGADVGRHGAMRPAGRVKNVRMGDFNRPPLSRQAKTACRCRYF